MISALEQDSSPIRKTSFFPNPVVKTTVIVRDIPVYEGWLTDGEQVRKASDTDSYEQAVRDILYEEPREKVRRRIRAGRALAEEHSMRATGEKLYQIEQKLL